MSKRSLKIILDRLSIACSAIGIRGLNNADFNQETMSVTIPDTGIEIMKDHMPGSDSWIIYENYSVPDTINGGHDVIREEIARYGVGNEIEIVRVAVSEAASRMIDAALDSV